MTITQSNDGPVMLDGKPVSAEELRNMLPHDVQEVIRLKKRVQCLEDALLARAYGKDAPCPHVVGHGGPGLTCCLLCGALLVVPNGREHMYRDVGRL